MAISHANRGKEGEKKIQAELDALSRAFANFDYARLYDTHSAGNFIPPQVADFEFFWPTHHGVIEVKQVAHDYRLPKKNLGTDQIGRIRKRQLAGGQCWVAVYHSTTGMWRMAPIDWFHARKDAASWDLRELPAYVSCGQMLDQHILKAGGAC